MDKNGFVGLSAVEPTWYEELANPCLLPVMKMPSLYEVLCFQCDKNDISLIPKLELSISWSSETGAYFAYMGQVIAVWYNSEYEFKNSFQPSWYAVHWIYWKLQYIRITLMTSQGCWRRQNSWFCGIAHIWMSLLIGFLHQLFLNLLHNDYKLALFHCCYRPGRVTPYMIVVF